MADLAPRKSDGEGTPELRRSDVERLIDDIVDDTFPASDPPAWGVAAARLARSREGDRAAGARGQPAELGDRQESGKPGG